MKLHLALAALAMFVLTPIWALVEYETHGGFERFSSSGHRGDWKPWIVGIAIAAFAWPALLALRVRFERPPTEAELRHEVARLGWRLEGRRGS